MPALLAEPGMPIWIDLATTDLSRAQDFYSTLLGWEFDSLCDTYVIAKCKGMPVAGFGAVPEDKSSLWGILLYAPDLQEAHDRAVDLGATSILAPQEVGRGGKMAVIVDPSGATVGIKQPAMNEPFFAAGEPGTPVWYELMVGSEYEATLKFYHELADWDIAVHSNSENLKYATGEREGAALCGLWDTSDLEETPSMWMVYLGVADVDHAAKMVKKLGGTVIRKPWDAEIGRMCTIQDPGGALLNLCQVEEYQEDPVHEPDLLAP